ncbi:MAG: hypothetical protein K2W96_24200 [Gemmataceae bacterium]|nr:hypothetical protein [Gemmataceae bacterium]
MLALVLLLAPAADLSGSWPEGYWHTPSNDHRGPLRAEFTRISATQYRVVFKGRFAAIIPFRYASTLDIVDEQPGRTLLSSEQRLPLFGLFRLGAEGTESDFRATFSSRRYNGEFVLRRCGCR